jgi:hypothetical protein
MKKYIDVERHYVDKRVSSVTCDICKKEYNGDFWDREPYSALDTTVELKIGSCYPEGGSGEYFTFDICPKCFETKLIPLLKREFNAEVTIEEFDSW